ncbi:MAG: alpha/beta hydrolase family protein [Actinomycetota bacterium]|nr:alpha/beta hydrolase family protein [Actinomycetota bacterium]
MSTITLPPQPRPIPPFVPDLGSISDCSARLLAASAQVDDLGTFVAGGARVGDWSGRGATAYHSSIAPIGRGADAMSLALRAVARRVEAHAAEMTTLVRRRDDLVERRQELTQQIALLQDEATGATPAEVPALQAACDQVRTQVQSLDGDVTRWVTDVSVEEQEMVDALLRVLSLDQVETAYGGIADPADAALATMPTSRATPEDVNTWWDGLTTGQQQAILAASPGSIGNRDGIPAGVRDDANTVTLERDLAEWTLLEERGLLTDDERQWLDNARAAGRAVQAIEGRVDPVTGEPIESRLSIYDPAAFDGDGAVAISAGDLDTADNVAVVVPGFGTDAESAPYHADRAATIYESTRYLDDTQTNATMFWIGYDAPDNLPWTGGGWDGAGVVTEAAATAGGDRLADTIDGLRAGRDGEPAHLTTIGHSYGSTTTGHGAHDHGLATDDLVFAGSPGVGADTGHARDTGLDPDHVWAGANSRDPITYLANHGWVHGETLGGAGLGDDPAEDDFGGTRFQAESTTRGALPDVDQHVRYFDHGTESLYNISQIVNGGYDEVLEAEPNHDPWWGGVQDPELDRDPTTQVTR